MFPYCWQNALLRISYHAGVQGKKLAVQLCRVLDFVCGLLSRRGRRNKDCTKVEYPEIAAGKGER